MSDYYILKGHEVEKVDLVTWAKWLEENHSAKIVKQEDVGGYFVSTVFLGLDHRFGDGPPVLFETLVFKRKPDGEVDYCEVHGERCGTYDGAEEMHTRCCEYVRTSLVN